MTNQPERRSKIVEKMEEHDFMQRLSQLIAAARAVVDDESIDSGGLSEINTRLVSVLRVKLRYFEGDDA